MFSAKKFHEDEMIHYKTEHGRVDMDGSRRSYSKKNITKNNKQN